MIATADPATKHASVLADFFKSTPESRTIVEAQTRVTKPPSVIEWGEKHFYIPTDLGRPRLIKFHEHQKVIMELFFNDRVSKYFNCEPTFQTLVYSTIKKSGKTAISALVARWIAETWGSHVEVYALANDLEQARGRLYAAALASIELDPRYARADKGIKNLWRIIERQATYLPSHSTIKAVSADYKGEAGSNPVATFWSELWGYTSEASQRLWEELTPVPTRPRSIRYVETYAGYEGESSILNELEDRIKDRKQSYRLQHDDLDKLGLNWPYPRDQQLPFYINIPSRTFAYWDEGVEARRMIWQVPAYYQAQAADLRESAFKRLHLNIRVSNAEQFIPPEWWDRLLVDPTMLDKDTPLVIGADASVTGDCTGLVAVSRDPKNPDRVLQRLAVSWQPQDGRPLDYSLTIEPTLRRWCTGHSHPLKENCDTHSKVDVLGKCVPTKPYNIVEVAYDEYQLHDLMTRLRNEAIAWCRKFGQQADRSIADKALFDMIRDMRIHHMGDPDLRDHILNCAAKIPPDDNTRLRLIKKAQKSKIDLAVCLSMAANECLRLNLS